MHHVTSNEGFLTTRVACGGDFPKSQDLEYANSIITISCYAQAIETLFISAISIAELRFGIASMPVGKRRSILHDPLEGEVLPLFDRRILPFDVGTSHFYAALMADGRKSGKAIAKADGYIAATAAENRLAVATRDTSPFEAAGLRVINP